MIRQRLDRALLLSPYRTSAIVLLAAVLLSHLPLLSAGYVQDDHVAVESNEIAATGSVAAVFGSSYWQGVKGGDRSLYRPVAIGSYAAERAAFGGAKPAASHAVNLALHALACWLVFVVALRCGLTIEASLLGALLFAVGPSKSEAVANVVGRAEVLAAVFTLGAVGLARARGSRAAAWGAAACVFLACGSKETGMVALPLVALAAFAGRSRSSVTAHGASRDGRLRTYREGVLDVVGMLLPSVLAFLAFVILRTRALEAFFPAQTVPLMDNPLAAEQGVRAWATALGLAARYAGIVLLPWGLANDYSGGSVAIETTLLAWRPIAGAAVLAALCAPAFRGRTLALFSAIALLPYLLVSNLIVPVGAILAERFLYLPVAGCCLLAAAAIARYGTPARRTALALVVVLAGVMFARSLDWKDDASIFAATARNNPASPRAPFWLGTLAVEGGRTDAAMAYFDASIASWPAFASPWHDKGILLARAGDAAGAVRALEEAIRLEPTWTTPKYNLALVLRRAGDLDAARKQARKALLLDPANAKYRALAE